MMEDQTQTDEQNEAEEVEEIEQPLPRYVISQEQAQLYGRALPLMIYNRLGYMGQQAFDEEPTPDSDVKPYIDRIADVDSHEHDYLLPDTPLKEAIFRVILANRNKPMTAEEISDILSEKWSMTAYPRDLSAHVIQKLLETSRSYCIVSVPGE